MSASVKKNTKTHSQLVKECVCNVAGVWQYYTDGKLTESQLNEISSVLDKILPKDFTTEGWTKAADAYDAKIAEETEDKACNE